MIAVQLIYIGILGVVIGSFLNVCIYRIPLGESIAFPPSHCTSCNTKLKPMDLIPILSYLIRKGRCKYCGERISIIYPLIEALNGIVYLILFIKFGASIAFIKFAVLSSLLIVISFIDLNHQSIYDNTIILGFIAGVIFNIFNGFKFNFINGIVGLLVGGGLFLIIMLASKGGMGGGDVELMALLGFFLGWKQIILISLMSFILGGLISVLLMVSGIKKRKDYIPFGPFIAISGFIAIIFGNGIINWYWSIL